jgi:hypothetical protein
LAVTILTALSLFISGPTPDASKPVATASSPGAARTSTQTRAAYGQLPLSFEANLGQADKAVNFLARGAGYALSLSPTRAVFALTRRSGEQSQKRAAASPALLQMNLVGANRGAEVEGLSELQGKVNYFIGKDRARWRTDIPTFGRVLYTEVYPGIDVAYYGNQKQLEYDFVVAPGGDARVIALEFAGAERVEIASATGELLLTVQDSTIRQPKPLVYQEVAGARREIAGAYMLEDGGHVRFAVGEYDKSLPLIIDPVLVYSTYLGGSGNEQVNDITVDSSGNAYMCGETNSTNFPMANAFDSTFNAGNAATDNDAFITKLNAAGNALIYSTYIGGTGTDFNVSGDDRCRGIAIDSAGSAYVVGQTRSANFPTANAIQSTFGGGISEGFLTKLNAAGNALVYSTYIGGDTFDESRAVAVDSSGNAYVAGRTTSSNFATVNPIQSTFKGGGSDATITKVNAAGSAYVYSTYLGGGVSGSGNPFDAAFGIALDSAGNAYITGQTTSTDFPTANALQATFGGGSPDGDAFVAKLNAAGSALVYSTYLGGSDNDVGSDIAVDSSGNAYVTGHANSTNFPTANALQSTLSGTGDAFVTKLNAAGSALVYSTYLGGSSDDSGNDISLDSSANAYIGGGTNSTNFPTANATQAAYGGGTVDAFVTKLNTAGNALVYSTYLGGSALDRVNTTTVDSAGSVYVAGTTGSTNFPVLGPLQGANAGGDDAFVTKISDTATPPVLSLSQASYTVGEAGVVVAVSVLRSGDASQPATISFTTSDTFGLNECSTVTGVASARCDYTISVGKLTFAVGETSKTVNVSIVDDSYAEGTENFTFTLSNPTNSTLGALSQATITITDNDTTTGANPLNGVDFFIRQHYLDFLGREPDAPGFQGWRDTLNNCAPGNTACDRIEVSSAFFRSEEFQTRGYFIYRFYSVLGRIPRYSGFIPDFAKVMGFISATQLEANKAAFVDEFMARQEFQTKYGSLTSPTAYVDALLQTVGLPNHPSRGTWITALTNQTMTRGQVLRALVESTEVYNKYFNEAFVVMQYFGYLRRDPDILYLQWIQTLSQNNGDYRTMVSGFLNSIEYRRRFGPAS